MIKSNKNVTKLLTSVIITVILLLVGSCQNWMSSDDFMSKIEDEVHDANAKEVNVYVRYANAKMGTTEPQGNTKMKVDVTSKISAVTNDDYGFVKWAAFSTEDFPSDKQHSKLTFLNEENYNENYKTKELPSDVVSFSNPNNPATEVKILTARSDIFIIPIVATRPSYVQSVPANADNNVVKNTSIRILFSKAIDKKTLYDEDGNVNYSITTGFAGITEDSGDIEANDITNYFEPTLSESGKMLTLKLKEKEDKSGTLLLDPKQRITVTLLEGLCDLYGFAMNGNYTFSFVTGNNTDSLAPMIEVIYGGGTGAIDEVFVSFHDVDENGDPTVGGVGTDAAKNAPKDINSNEYTDKLVAQRVYDKVNLYIKATDIILSGDLIPNPAKDYNEENVSFIGISASLYIDKDGNAIVPDESTTIAKKNYIYVSGQIDSGAEENPLFTEKVPLTNGGTIYTYDVSSLPDGLIKIDVWGIDMTGNSGGPNDAGSPYYKKQDNGYKSIFVVKDTTAINSVVEAKKIDSNSTAAPYHWYNYDTLSTIELYDGDGANKIHDAGHEKLRSLDKNLWWNFSTSKTAESSGWKLIHDENGDRVKYLFTTAKVPAKDGPIDITVFMRDDMGNLSDPVVLDQIMYDNTKPTVTLKKGKGDFVDATTGEAVLHASEKEGEAINQILKVEIGEANENNAGSGIRRMEIHVKKDGQEVAVPLDATKFAVKYAPASITNPTPSSEGVRDITPAADDTATTANLKVFNVNDSNKITSGTLFIYGITLGTTDGQYEISVDLYDSALNKTTAPAKTIMARDTTDPKIGKVQVMNVASRKVYGHDDVTWWLPYDRFEDANNLSKVTLKITANEAGSGLKYLKLAENAEFTENTKLYVGSELLTRDKDYKLNTAAKTIELLDWYTPKLINANGGTHEITLENIKLNNINAPAGTSQGNKIKLTTDDFVGKTTDNANNIYYGDTSVTGTLVYADSLAPQIASLTVEDSAKNTTTNPDDKAYDKDNFTDSQTVVLYLTLGDTEVGNKGSGVNKVILSDNAVFTGTTEIFVVNGSTETKLTKSSDYTIDSDNKSVNFTKVFTETNKLKFTNVNIISAENGPQIIKADVQDFAGIKSVTSKNTNTIVFDNDPPVVSAITWIPDNTTVTAGTTNTNTILNQNLKVDFTEETAGVKVLKMEIIHQDVSTTPYAIPFGNASDVNFKLFDESNTELVKGTDYTIDGQYIILTKPKTTGSLSFRGITLKAAREEGTYNVKVSMLDAAELKAETSKTMVIDTVAPVITKDLEIKGHKESVELANTTSSLDGKWLAKEWIGGSNKAPDSIPVYITVKEKSSGVKVLKFANSVTLDADRTTLYTVDSTGVETEVTPRSRYEVVPKTKEIIIKSELDAKTLFSRQDESEFKILVKNIGFENADSASKESINSISLIASDIAKNDSLSKSTTESRILSDSISPAAPTGLTLKDRAHSTANKTIEASAGYTNESIVDMTFNLTDSEKFGSGYHKFVLTGASFIGGNSADKTTITVKDSSGTVIPNVEFALSADGKTLTLKKTGQATDVYAVIRQAVSVELKNVQLDNASTNGSHTVTLKAYDLTGWDSTAASTSITLDTEKPALEKGVFAANYTNSSAAYYQPSINVYPHANGETAEGVSINYDGKSVPTFYTATTYKTGYYQVNGEVSSSSSAPAVTNFVHGAVLGIRGKDNIRLGGWTRAKTFLYYYKYSSTDAPFSKTESGILGSTNPEFDINNKGNNNNQPTGNNTATGTTLWFGFDEGKYSAVIVDEAGNCSDVFHFAVVRDVEKPAKEWDSGSNADSLNKRVLLQMPDASANVFTNSDVAVANYSDFPDFNADYMSRYPIRTKKYVTKKTSGNYKIQLNLGGNYSADTPIKKIDNTEASATTKYTELDATTDSSPIEMYAVSTYYGSWPTKEISSGDSGSSWMYAPVVPYGTTFPSGQTHNVHSYSENSSNLAYVLGHNYFGYGTGRADSSAWKIPNQNVTWHNYKYTGSWATDTGNGIRSQIDSNNNLIIEIPNTQSTAPVSVFLRDGCGNMQYVVCGLYEVSGKQVAISFVIDDKLGSAPTSNGVVTTPFILQFPYSYYDSASDVQWGSYNFHVGTQSGNSEAPSTQYGTGGVRGFIKDEVKHATYYNPSITYSDTDLQFKHGFALHFFPNGVDREEASNIIGKESITFSDADWSDTEKAKGIRKATATDIAAGNYTCRALMYCTNSTTVPTYAQIKACLDAEKNRSASEKTGQVTDWSYVQVSSSAIEAILFVDYPKPNYSKLNWTINSSHEPIPYYMWYIFEDAVGNYELAKVVNSAVSGNYLKAAPSASGTDYDKWLYDATAPVLNIRGTTVKANGLQTTNAANQLKDQGTTSASLATQVNKLIATNNGFVPYLDGTTVWISTDYDRTGRSSSLLNSNTGWGTTHKVEDGNSLITKREYLPFVDLEVDEITGIRAFCWTNSDTTPSGVAYTGNTQGDSTENKWYAGNYATSLTYNIGISFGYGTAENAYLGSGSYGTSKYTGTKVNTLIPGSKLSADTAQPLYLHVMDWTGNIASYRIGSNNLTFKNDKKEPVSEYTDNTTIQAITSSSPNEYYVKWDGSYVNVRIAGKGAGSAENKQTIKVRYPVEYFKDYAVYTDETKILGAGYKGLSFTNYDINSVKRDSTGPYLELDYDTYKDWSNSPTRTVYYYDNVGNIVSKYVKFTYDTEAPKVKSVSLVTQSSSGTEFADEEIGASKDTELVTSYGKCRSYEKPAEFYDNIAKIPASDLQVVYINKNGTSKFHVNWDEDNDSTDVADVQVNTWDKDAVNGDGSKGKWVTVTSRKDNSGQWNGDSYMGSSYSSGYDILSSSSNPFSTTGTYFQVLAVDFSGNIACQYFKIILDKTPPSFSTTTPKPVVTLRKGSIGKITNNGTDNYYYAADASYPLKLSFGIVDAGSGSVTALKKFKYSFDGSTWLPANGYISNPDNFEIDISSGNIETFYFMDILGNKQTTALTPGFSYTYNASGTSTTVSIPKLTAYTATPDAPAITTKVVGPNLNDPNSTKYNIVEQVETRGKGLKDDYKTYNKANWTHLYTEKFENVDNTIRIKEQKGYERTKVRITFPEPSNSNKIKGYIKSNTALNIHSYDTDQIGKYTFADNFANVFEDNLDTNHAEDAAFTRYYYAVDIVGNISPALTLTYSYENPHIPKDVALIDPLNSSTDKTNNNYIDADVKAQMETDGIDFAKIIKVTAPEKQNADKKYVKYFSKGFMVVRCTLYQKAGADYSETPNKIELWDKWGETEDDRKLRAESGPADDSTLFHVYPSDEKDGNRYYCWIAFKPGKLTTIAGATEEDPPTYLFEPYVVDNNLEFNGSNFHGFIKGATCQSGFIPLDPESTNAQNKVGWILDKEAPVIEGSSYVTDDNHVIGYTPTPSLSRAYDNTVGPGYVSVTYQRGTTISIPVANLKDEMSGLAKYKFVVSGQNVDDVNWETATPSNDMYTFTLPPVEAIHKNISLYLQDNFGNVSSTPYTLAHPEAGAEIWWIVNDILTKEGAVTTWGEAPEWTAAAENYTFTVMPPEGSIIRKVTIKVDGQEKNSENINWGTYKFNGYPEGSQSPELNGSKGWLVVNDDDKKGLDITVKQITKDWANHKIEISINDDTNLTKTYNNFVTAKTFSGNNINIDTANATITTTEGGVRVCTIPYNLTDGAPDNLLTSISATPANVVTNAEFDKTNHKIVLTGVPVPVWTGAVAIGLTINGTITKDAVYTVPKRTLAVSDITLDLENPSLNGTTLTIPVTLNNGASETDVTNVTASVGESTLTASLNDSGNAITIEGIPAANFTSAQEIKLVLNTNIDLGTVYTVAKRALTDEDITLKYNNNTPAYDQNQNSYYLTIELPSPLTVTSVTKPEDSAITVTWDANNATGVTVGNVIQSWTEDTPVKLVINGVTKLVFNVPQKTLTDVTVASNPDTWAADATYKVTVTAAAGAPITSVKLKINTTETEIDSSKISGLGEGNVVPASGSFTVNLAKIDQTTSAQIVSIIINGIEKSLFEIAAATGGGNPEHQDNRFFGRLFTGKGSQEVYTFGDSPKTAGALQSHVVELPKFIQKFWQNEETAADEVTTTVTKESKKAEKKSSKKTSKKAAKKAVEAVTETAAALEVTELPVEALEEAKADDQLAMILPQTANTEEAELVEPQASVSAGAVDVSVTEAEPASHSSAVIWVILAVFCTAIAGLVLCLKKKRA